MNRALATVAAASALSAGACVSGGFGLGSSAPSPTAVSPPAPAGAALGGILAGPIGEKLSEADRQAAYQAQIAALDSGQRRAWRGTDAFGYVEVGAIAEGALGSCRPYSQTIYVGGRPQRGQGLGCRAPDGGWRMAN
jgi:surface antigen